MDNMNLHQSQVDVTLKLCSQIYQMAYNAKVNKRNCQEVAQRVKALEELVHNVKQRERGGISPTVENALKELCSTLKSVKTLMEQFTRNNTLRGLKKSGSHDHQFSNVDEWLTDHFQVLFGALQIDHGKNPSSMPPMKYNSTASMSQPRTTPPMTTYSSIASMSQPRTMPPMTTYNRTASMSQPRNMPPMAFNLTASMPQPMNMPPMTFNPTVPMPQPMNMPPMAFNPTVPMPQPGTMNDTTTPAPVGWLIPSMAISDSIPFPAPIGFVTQTTSEPNIGFSI